MIETQFDEAETESENRSVAVDRQLIEDALIGAWKESDGKAHVLYLVRGMSDQMMLEYGVREDDRDDDCIRPTDVVDNVVIEGGTVVNYRLRDEVTIGGETLNVRC